MKMMQNENKFCKKVKFCVLIVLTVFIFLVVRWCFFEKQDSSIRISPEEILSILRSNDYEINNVVIVNEGDLGPMGHQMQGYEFLLVSDENEYHMYVEDYKDYKKARKAVSIINNFDDQMHGGYAYAFSFGSIVIQLYPSDKGFGKELYRLLKHGTLDANTNFP